MEISNHSFGQNNLNCQINQINQNGQLYTCRYCYEEFSSRNDVLCPCECDGDLKYICKECLLKDVSVSQGDRNTKCPTCKNSYNKDNSKNNFDIEFSLRGKMIVRTYVLIVMLFFIYILSSETEYDFLIYVFLILIFFYLFVTAHNHNHMFYPFLICLVVLDIEFLPPYVKHVMLSLFGFVFCISSMYNSQKYLHNDRIEYSIDRDLNKGLCIYDKELDRFVKIN